MHGKPLDGVHPTEAAVAARTMAALSEAYSSSELRTGPYRDGAAAQSVDDAFLDRFGVIGTPSQCAERLQEIIQLDPALTRIVLMTKSPGRDLNEENAARFASEVLPLLDR